MSDPRTRSKENNWEPQALPAFPVPPKEQQETGAIPPLDDPPDVTAYANDADTLSPPGNDEEAYTNEPPPLKPNLPDPNAPYTGLTIGKVPWELGNLQPAPEDPSDQNRILSDLLATQLPSPATSFDGAATSESSKRTANRVRPPADPPVRQTARVSGMTPTTRACRDIVTVLIRAPFDAWYDQWMLQVDNDTIDPDGVDYFDDAVRMFELAALGMAAAALRVHLDAHQAAYAAAGVTLLVEPRIPQADQIVCRLGVFETMHEDGQGQREDGELSFVETVAHDALRVPVYRAAESPFPAAVFAPGDPFFSAVDDSALLSDTMLADVRAHPEQYALVDVQVTTLYAHLALLAQDDDEAGASDMAMTA